MSATQTRVAIGGLAAVLALAAPVVMRWEGLSLTPYPDVAQRITTWCYGETAGTPKARYTKAECEALLNASLTKHAKPIIACLPPSTPVEVQAAFVVFGYNVGVIAACGSTAAKKARAGDFRAACDALLAWDKARVNGKLVVVRGLANRRADERALCLRGLA